VCVHSDHGLDLGDHGHWLKRSLHESDLRVPLLIRVPGQSSPSRGSPNFNHDELSKQRLPAVVHAVVELVDLFPTLVEVAGLPPLPASEGLDGSSLAPLLRGDPSGEEAHGEGTCSDGAGGGGGGGGGCAPGGAGFADGPRVALSMYFRCPGGGGPAWLDSALCGAGAGRKGFMGFSIAVAVSARALAGEGLATSWPASGAASVAGSVAASVAGSVAGLGAGSGDAPRRQQSTAALQRAAALLGDGDGGGNGRNGGGGGEEVRLWRYTAWLPWDGGAGPGGVGAVDWDRLAMGAPGAAAAAVTGKGHGRAEAARAVPRGLPVAEELYAHWAGDAATGGGGHHGSGGGSEGGGGGGGGGGGDGPSVGSFEGPNLAAPGNEAFAPVVAALRAKLLRRLAARHAALMQPLLLLASAPQAPPTTPPQPGSGPARPASVALVPAFPLPSVGSGAAAAAAAVATAAASSGGASAPPPPLTAEEASQAKLADVSRRARWDWGPEDALRFAEASAAEAAGVGRSGAGGGDGSASEGSGGRSGSGGDDVEGSRGAPPAATVLLFGHTGCRRGSDARARQLAAVASQVQLWFEPLAAKGFKVTVLVATNGHDRAGTAAAAAATYGKGATGENQGGDARGDGHDDGCGPAWATALRHAYGHFLGRLVLDDCDDYPAKRCLLRRVLDLWDEATNAMAATEATAVAAGPAAGPAAKLAVKAAAAEALAKRPAYRPGDVVLLGRPDLAFKAPRGSALSLALVADRDALAWAHKCEDFAWERFRCVADALVSVPAPAFRGFRSACLGTRTCHPDAGAEPLPRGRTPNPLPERAFNGSSAFLVADSGHGCLACAALKGAALKGAALKGAAHGGDPGCGAGGTGRGGSGGSGGGSSGGSSGSGSNSSGSGDVACGLAGRGLGFAWDAEQEADPRSTRAHNPFYTFASRHGE